MTVEQLIQCDAATLEAMTDAELIEHFKPMFPITRPEMNPLKVKKQEQQLALTNPKLAQGLALAKSLGIDLGSSLQPYRKPKSK